MPGFRSHTPPLLAAGMYIGSTETTAFHGAVLDKAGKALKGVQASYVPGIVKLFDEILVNAMDNRARDSRMDLIKVTLPPLGRSAASGTEISVWNNGQGIPVRQHADEGVLVPELIMGHLMTGSSFDDTSTAATGGRHGYGAKLTNIFSSSFTVETVDSRAGKGFRKTWRDNMSASTPADVWKVPRSGKAAGDYTCISFTPDLDRFGVGSLSSGTVAALHQRVLDAAALMGSHGVQVVLNGERVSIPSLHAYAELHGPGAPLVSSSSAAGKWEFAVGVSSSHQPPGHGAAPLPLPLTNGSVESCSFVNGMRTCRGGTHVAAVVDPLVTKLTPLIARRNKHLRVTPQTVRAHLRVFLAAHLPGCSFDSQAKEQLVSEVPSEYLPVISDAFAKRVAEEGGLEAAVVATLAAKAKASSARAVKKAVKESDVRSIPKLEDANWAGGRRSHQCTLILTEGDSAKALAMAGLSVVGRDAYGVFPLRGKVLNVRDMTPKAAVSNAEVAALVSILGLQFGASYEDMPPQDRPLRYGRVLIMTDQDNDGAHIKGLLVNLFHTFWPDLCRASNGQDDSFLQQFITPIIKAKRGALTHQFFSATAFNQWQADPQSDWSTSGGKGWSVKYYKGLGTSTATEGKAYFKDLPKHKIPFTWAGDADDEAIAMAFAKDRVSQRKAWLSKVQPTQQPQYQADGRAPSFSEFVDEELVHFSRADIQRSLPCVFDGLKPSQRKVLFALLARGAGEVKVAQLAGYVAEHTAYHHGEASLVGTIVNMAQDFVGANNVPLLSPIGQFGTRLTGGKDAASARYIFTALSPLARALFPAADDSLLPRVVDDGKAVEPISYLPVVPLLLANGSEGIGTGWSTSVPPHNPLALIDEIRSALDRDSDEGPPFTSTKHYSNVPVALHPWVRGFQGTIAPAEGGSFFTSGAVSLESSPSRTRQGLCQGVRITELPLRKWTEEYRRTLRKLQESGIVRTFSEHHTDTTVDFTVKLAVQEGQAVLDESQVLDALKLTSKLSVSNMHALDCLGSVLKLHSPSDVLRNHFTARLSAYEARLKVQRAQAAHDAALLEAKHQFVQAVVKGDLPLLNQPSDSVIAALSKRGLPSQLHLDMTVAGKMDEARSQVCHALGLQSNPVLAPQNASEQVSHASFRYLLNMPLSQLTTEAMRKLQKDAEDKRTVLRALESDTAKAAWGRDLDALESALRQLPGIPPS